MIIPRNLDHFVGKKLVDMRLLTQEESNYGFSEELVLNFNDGSEILIYFENKNIIVEGE